MKTIHQSGNFTSSEVTLDTDPTNWNYSIHPALADLDEDGDYDLVIGNYYDGYLRYYKQTTPGNFVEETGDWNPVQKTGNPFDGFDLGLSASPAFIDFNDDGLPDLFVADEDGYYDNKYSDKIIIKTQRTVFLQK
ncbi:MAG: VCBS repeat-containing protein [Cyclobacteriaceae bacterium]